MSETLKEWVSKAEGDYRVAARELAVTEAPNFDAVCFHAQQCAEKLFKAALIRHQVVPPKIHDLVELSRLLAAADPGWQWPIQELRRLSQSAVDTRYPGTFASRSEAERALDICTRLRERLRGVLDSGIG
jgi:HEPN domain-containing protein